MRVLFRCNIYFSAFGLISFAVANAENCTAPPLRLPFRNVTLRYTEPHAERSYGIELVVGDQVIAASPNPNFNQTYIAGFNKSCDGVLDMPRDCYLSEPIPTIDYTQYLMTTSDSELRLGGAYDSSLSQTYIRESTVSGYEPDSSDILSVVDANIVVDRFGFVTAGAMFLSSRANIGLGRGSMFLSSLSTLIPSQTWSFFAGWEGDTANTTKEGSLIIGGYDSRLMSSKFVDIPMRPLPFVSNTPAYGICHLVVTISSMSIFGQTFGDGVTFDACIDPNFSGIELPISLLQASIDTIMSFDGLDNDFKRSKMQDPIQILAVTWLSTRFKEEEDYALVLNKTWFDESAEVIKMNDFGPNDSTVRPLDTIRGLSFEINGLKVDIPIHQLFKRIPKNNTHVAVPISETIGGLPRLGLLFLSSTYLYVNPLNETFGLASISLPLSTNENIISFADNSCTEEIFVSPSQGKLSMSGIIGVSVSSVAFVTIIAVCFIICRRCRRQKRCLPTIPARPGFAEMDGSSIYHIADHYANYNDPPTPPPPPKPLFF